MAYIATYFHCSVGLSLQPTIVPLSIVAEIGVARRIVGPEAALTGRHMRVRCATERAADCAGGQAEEHRGGVLSIEAVVAMMVAIPPLITRLVPPMAVAVPIAAIVVPIVAAIIIDDAVLAFEQHSRLGRGACRDPVRGEENRSKRGTQCFSHGRAKLGGAVDYLRRSDDSILIHSFFLQSP